MAKGLFNSTVAINENVKKSMKRWEDENIRVSNSPVLATLYAVNLEASSVSVGTLDVNSYVGEDSPIRYNKVKNFRLLVDSEIFGPDTKENWGFEIDSQLNVMFYPGLANIEDNSLIVFNNMPNLYFRVTNSNLSRAMPNTYVQTSMTVHFVKNDVDKKYLALENQVVQNYTLDKYSDGSYVISDEIISKKNALEELLDDCLDTYITTFFDKDINSIILKDGTSILYDPYLRHFLHKNRILSDMKFNSFLLTSEEVMLDEKFDSLYRKSIYGRLERKKTLKSSNYEFWSYSFSNLSDELSWSRLYEFYKTYDIRVITRVDGAVSNTIPEAGATELDTIIYNYMQNSDLNKLNSIIFDTLDDYDIEETHEHMVKFAICIYILKQKINSLIGRTIDNNIIEEVL